MDDPLPQACRPLRYLLTRAQMLSPLPNPHLQLSNTEPRLATVSCHPQVSLELLSVVAERATTGPLYSNPDGVMRRCLLDFCLSLLSWRPCTQCPSVRHSSWQPTGPTWHRLQPRSPPLGRARSREAAAAAEAARGGSHPRQPSLLPQRLR